MSDLSVHDKAILNCIFNPNLPLSEYYEEELSNDIKDEELDTPEFKQIKLVEIDAIREAEKGEYDTALLIFEKAIKAAPNIASLYNNRAQVYALKGLIDEAFEDLTEAVQLAKETQNKTLCQALCQRGLIYKKRDQIELAKVDFESATKIGSQFAKSQLVELNPYAALCNQMLRKVMNELQ